MSAASATDASANPPAGRLGVLVFGLLVLASFAAFFLAQRLKHIPTAVQQLRFDAAFYPEGGGTPAAEPISFQIERADRVTVRVLSAKGALVATLVSEHHLAAYTTYSVSWNGLRGAPGPEGQPPGSPAPRGEYRIQVILAHRKVEVRSPSAVQLERVPR